MEQELLPTRRDRGELNSPLLLLFRGKRAFYTIYQNLPCCLGEVAGAFSFVGGWPYGHCNQGNLEVAKLFRAIII
jgi:hypothetical protein